MNCQKQNMNARVADSSGKPTVISTFAGCGGSSLGYHLAGFKELLAVEWDDNAVETFRLNFPDVPVYHGDIAKLTGDECMRLAGIERGQLDILDGSPPCQGFSTAGKRRFDDPRNSLFKEYARLLNDLQPRVFIMENVSGLIKGVMKQAYLQIIKTLRECGYSAKGELMNAMYYNVPQSRERVIIIGVRNDIGIEPSHPKPQTRPITPIMALKDCPEGEIKKLPDWLLVAARYMCAGNYSGKNAERAFMKARGKSAGAINTKLLSWGRVSCTLVKSEISSTGIIHPDRKRYLTIPEMKRIASFPDEFRLAGDRGMQVSRIGNSVPPNLMRAIATHIKDHILKA
jgi:DNA (cytosine-5)-methyltransferase 1